MRAVNIYILTRLLNSNLYSYYEKALSLRDDEIKVRPEEIDLIKALIANFKFHKTSFEIMDGWFYSFIIPQIGKEFDLLKIDKKGTVVNLELKSQPVLQEKIEKQLKQNRYYLSHIANTIYSFTYVKEDETVSQLYVYDNALRKSSFEELIEKLSEINTPVTQNIELLFRPIDYLISPLNTPEKFLNGNYYLSAQQENIKKEIISSSEGIRSIWGITGSAGTGKTLLLYDLAKSLCNRSRVCIVHCGMLSDGHKYINSHINGILVIDAKSLSEELIKNYSIVCVDETQRLYTSGLKIILEAFNSGIVETCVFSYDFAQVLSKAEQKRNNPQKLNEMDGFQERVLTDRIRTNKEVFSFIRNMMRLSDKPQKQINYDNVDILYANDNYEADTISRSYMKNGYTFITFTPSRFVNHSIDHYSGYINSHQVIGQEFDHVVVVLDNSFRYSPEGILQGREHPNPDYLFPHLFYQNISRAREKLCIIVLDNSDLFTKLLCIKEHVDVEGINSITIK